MDATPDDRLAQVLDRSRALGFLGPGPTAVHREHGEALLTLLHAIPGAARGLDLGAGGGVPGLVVARSLPDWRWTFLDAMEKRTAFLRAAVEDLGMGDRVEVVRARAEVAGRDPAHRGAYDVVTARSFGPPATTAECGAPFIRPGGILVVAEPPDADGSRWDADGLRRLGIDPVPVAVGRWVVLRVERAVDEFPRPNGRPAKRPLWT